jgi:glucose/arabinose dehydrogenase
MKEIYAGAVVTASLFALFLACAPSASAAGPVLVDGSVTIGGSAYDVRLPRGYRLEFLVNLLQPRFFVFGRSGEMFVGSRSGRVYRVDPSERRAEELVYLGGLPHSVAIRGDSLYVATTGELLETAYPTAAGALLKEDFSLVAVLPSLNGGHSSRTVGAGPDGRLYVSLGISGNCSNEYLDSSYPFESRRGGVFVLDESTSPPILQPFASGLRNPVGFDWHPDTGTMYATNAGPDHWGYDLPREVLAPLSRGSFHGMPWFQWIDGSFVRDNCITVAPPREGAEATAPTVTFDARSTPLGIAFAPADHRDPMLRRNAVVAVHGSWATLPSGGSGGDPATRRPPKLALVESGSGLPTAVHDLLTGFQLADGTRWARPAGIGFGADGAVYFTSDGGTHQGLFRLRRRSTPSILPLLLD